MCFTLGLNWIRFSGSHHRAAEQLSLWHQLCCRALCWSCSQTGASLTHAAVPRSSARPFSFQVLHFQCIYTNTPIYWCSMNSHSTYSVSKSYHSVKYNSGGPSTILFQCSSILLDFHHRYNSVLSAKILSSCFNTFICIMQMKHYFSGCFSI